MMLDRQNGEIPVQCTNFLIDRFWRWSVTSVR